MSVLAEFDGFVCNGLLNVVHFEQRMPKAISTLILSWDKWKLKQLFSASDFLVPEKGVRRVSEQVCASSPIKNQLMGKFSISSGSLVFRKATMSFAPPGATTDANRNLHSASATH